MGTLAGILAPEGAGKVSLKSLGTPPGTTLSGLDRILRTNGVSALLSGPAFGRQSMAGMAELALLLGLLDTISKKLKVDLLALQAASLLTTELKRICGSSGFKIALPRLPQIHPPLIPGLTHLSAASLALNPLGVDLFSATGAKQLQAMLAAPSTGRALAALAKAPVPTATVNRLSKLSKFALADLALRQMNKMPFPGRASTGAASPLAQLKTGSLTALWPAIAAGALSPQVKLPDPAQIASLNAEKANLQLLCRATGLDASDPQFPAKLSAKLASFQSGNLCRVLQANPIYEAHFEGASRLASCHSSLAAIRQSELGVDLFERAAGAKLAQAIPHMPTPGNSPLVGGGEWFDVIPALKRLAELGMAIS